MNVKDELEKAALRKRVAAHDRSLGDTFAEAQQTRQHWQSTYDETSEQ